MARTGRPATGNAKGEMLRVRIERDLLKRLDDVVVKRDSTRSELIREAVVSIIETEESKNG